MIDLSHIRGMTAGLARDIRRALRANTLRFDMNGHTVEVPVARVRLGGVFTRQKGEYLGGRWLYSQPILSHNMVVLEGRNRMLNGMFRAAGAFGNTYLAIGKSAGYTPNTNDTMTNIVSDIDEWASTDFDETARQQWVTDGDSTAGSLTNSASYAEYNIAAGISGLAAQNIILTTNAVIRDTAGVLVTSSKFPTPDTFNEGNKAIFGYTFTLVDDGV